MLKFLRALFLPSSNAVGIELPNLLRDPPPAELQVPYAATFPFASHISWVEGFPYLDWTAVNQWLATMDGEKDQAHAWAECEVAWLLHLKVALGNDYVLSQQGSALLLSSLEPKTAQATLNFVCKTLQRIDRVLDGIAKVPEWGRTILIVFGDDISYYRYAAHYYPEGEFAASSGMYISAGCGHFVTVNADLHAVEPVIAHEMTHGCLSHLPIPAWLNEGLAVNTERRICQVGGSLYSPKEIQDRHLRYWDECRIQDFWSGKSFLQSDEGSLLSYDLAQKIVAQLASDWNVFRAFVLSAEAADGGAAAAIECFGLDLGVAAAAVIGRESSENWMPTPNAWLEGQSD